jgi:hypothetical protein
MSTLLALLQDADPTLSSSMAADLRVGLVAINHQAQAEPASIEWSLNRWWQWLDDEGYNREVFREALQRLAAARISTAALADLFAACRTRGDEADGLALLHVLLEEIDADLIEPLQQLETLALTEERELALTAGGMSKAGNWGTGVAVGVTLLGLGILYYKKKKKKGTGDGEQREQRLTNELDTSVENEARHLSDAAIFDKDSGGRLLRDDSKRLGQEELGKALRDPEQAIKIAENVRQAQLNQMDIREYGEREIEVRMGQLVKDHLRVFGSKSEELVINQLKASDAFKEKVKNTVADNFKRDAEEEFSTLGLGSGDAQLERAYLDEAQLARANKNVVDSEWFNGELGFLLSQPAGRKARAYEINKLSTAYRDLVAEEVQAAQALKKDVREDLIGSLGPDMDVITEEVDTAVQVSKVKIDKAVVQIDMDAMVIERDAVRIAEADTAAAGRLL